jgi:hypothetical protein
VSFRTSDRYSKRLDELYIDNFVYGSDWNLFMTQCIDGWQKTAIVSFGLLLLHVFCFFLPVSPLLAYISSTLASLSLLMSGLLIHRHEELAMAGANPGHEYLSDVCSSRFKFQGVALAFALPKTFSLWAVLFLFSQCITIITQHCGLRSLIYVGAVFALLFAFQSATSRKSSPIWTLRFKSSKDESALV